MVPFVISEGEDGAHIGFIQSARSFYLDPGLEEYTRYMEMLKNAKEYDIPFNVYVFKETNDIAQVKYTSLEEIDAYNASKIPPLELKSATYESIVPSEAVLQTIINHIKNSGINFSYIGDGCYYRAHAMRRIFNEYGYECKKFFMYGTLAASNGSCCAHWVYHVAPYVSYRRSNGGTNPVIIDPSLFPDNPISTENTWLAACRNTTCSKNVVTTLVQVTPGEVYYASPDGSYQYDPDYIKTDATWAMYAGRSGCN